MGIFDVFLPSKVSHKKPKLLGDNPSRPIHIPHLGTYPGISVRAEFASLAMQALITSNHGSLSPEYIAGESVVYADALIKKLYESETDGK